MLERKNEDATTSAASSSFSKFSQEEFKEIAIRTNREHYDLVCELFKNLADIFETQNGVWQNVYYSGGPN